VAKVLIADDDPMILRLLDVSLSAAGHTVVTAADGREALELIEQDTPDIVVLDGMMPELGGLEALQSLKNAKSTADLPVILMTARAEEDDIAKGLELGATLYLVKPFPPKELVAAVERLTA
jgi:DNA-binding response OmpR family regulator